MVEDATNGRGEDAPIAEVGVVGLGRMGLPLARHLATAGYRVLGCDPSAEARAAAEPFATPLDTPADVGRAADLALVVVATDEQAVEVCRGADGLLRDARPGLIVCICSSVLPETVIGLDQPVRKASGALLDLPMTNGVRAAEAGTLTLLAGGEAEALERARPALASFSKAIHHLGPVGAGQTAKMVNNLLLWANLTACAEALGFGKAQGLEPRALQAALADCSSSSWVLAELARIQPTWPAKDLKQALAIADSLGAELPLVRCVAEQIGNYDRPALDRLLESPKDNPEKAERKRT